MAILVLLVRHAKPLMLDTAQSLSETGKEMQKKVNAYLKNELLIEPTEIWTSQIPRALETAQMIGKEFNITPKEEIALGELEMFDALEITNKFKEIADESTIIIVTHAPQIMRLATYWLGYQMFTTQPPTSSALFLEFPSKVEEGKASVVRFVTYSDINWQNPNPESK